MNYSNVEILTAILVKWGEPFIADFASHKRSTIPFVGNIEAFVRNSGWVSGDWSVGAELSPFASGIASSLVAPLVGQYLSAIPDKAVPRMAHSIVDTAIEKGEWSLMEGAVVFTKDDLLRLKRLLNANLPVSDVEQIKLKEEDEIC